MTMQRHIIKSFVLGVAFLLFPWCSFSQVFDTTGCYLREMMPLEVCQLKSISVDTATESIRVTWRVNHCDGVAGYCICSGSPCLGLDTLWSVNDTVYTCTAHASDVVHSYSVFAIDSCLHGGEMTDAASNMVAMVAADSCSRVVQCSWNAAALSSEEVRYVVWYWADDQLLLDTVGANRISLVQLDSSTMHLVVRVQALAGNDEAWSNRVEAQFAQPDSCNSRSDTSDDPIPKNPVDPFVPNCFTPSLSTNSHFCPIFPAASEPDNYTLYIYNRIGVLVFKTNELSDCWDGTHNGDPLPRETYIYYITYRFADDIRSKIGTILLLR